MKNYWRITGLESNGNRYLLLSCYYSILSGLEEQIMDAIFAQMKLLGKIFMFSDFIYCFLGFFTSVFSKPSYEIDQKKALYKEQDRNTYIKLATTTQPLKSSSTLFWFRFGLIGHWQHSLKLTFTMIVTAQILVKWLILLRFLVHLFLHYLQQFFFPFSLFPALANMLN